MLSRRVKLAFLACLSTCLLAAQEYRGTVTGTVTDATDALIPGVELTLRNAATNITFQATSNTAGAYTFPLLQPGTYRLEARKAGFKPAAFDGIVVQTGATVGVNVRLEVGDMTQSVEVTAEAPLLNTTTADSGQVIDEVRITELPMNGRSPFALARLSPGVIAAGMLNETKPYDVGGNSYISIAGSRRYSVEFALNGVPNGAPAGLFSGFLAYSPPVDATQEFRVVTNGFDAQYGHNGSGVVSVATKSGANEYHGSLYEFLQNEKLNATNFFTNRSGARKPPRRYNQFGGSLGGPFSLPKLFEGKNKAFFFFSYEGIRNSQPAAQLTTVPAEALRGGDFSLVAARGITVYNPFSISKDDKGAIVRAPFPGNRIPANLLNPIAKNMLSYVPLPNAGGAGQLEANYFNSTGRYDLYDNFLGRLDLNASAKNRMFFSIGQYTRTTTTGDLFKTLATGAGEDWPMWTAAFDETYVASPALVLNARMGYTRYTQDYLPKSVGFDPSVLGFPKSYVSQLVEGAFPRVDMTYFAGFGTGSRSTHYSEHDHQYFAAATATWVRGAHSLRFGFEGREKQNNIWDRGNASGGFSFSGKFAAGPALTANPGFGHDLATFLLGLPDAGSVDARSSVAARGRYYALFVQDDWKLTPNLTVNLGFRYDIESPGYERHNRIVAGWLNGPNPVEAQAAANYAQSPDSVLPASKFKVPGGLLYPGQQGTPGSMWNREWGRWQPRAGLAWNPGWWGKRVSFRTGAGVSYFSLTPSAGYQAGFTASTPFVATADNGATFLATLSDPFPSGIMQPAGGKDGPLTFLGQGVTIWQRDVKPTRNIRWQFSTQLQLTRSDVLEVNYTGSTQNHIGASVPMNYAPAEFMSASPVFDKAAADFLSAPVKNPFVGLIPANTSLGRATIPRAQLLYNFPQFTSVFLGNENSGSETFNSVYFSWERRLAGGWTVLSNYMISKQLWARQKQNPQDARLVRVPGSEDRPQQLTISSSYELPFGRNKRFLSNAGPVLSRIAGGWQVNGIYFRQSGAALSWGPMVFTGSSWDDIKNVPGGRSIDQWFNTAVFDRTAARQPNTNYQFRYFPYSIGAVRAPDAVSFDFSVAKRTQLRESADLQFRAEFFNIFNHPTFGGPNTSPTSSQFGRISSQANLPRAIQLGLRLAF